MHNWLLMPKRIMLVFKMLKDKLTLYLPNSLLKTPALKQWPKTLNLPLNKKEKT